MARIGILGGTFHPIHNGHLYIAKAALEHLHLDEVWVMPAGLPPHKQVKGDISRFERFGMCEAAVTGVPGLKAISYEIYKPTPSYTFETLEYFRQLRKALAIDISLYLQG